MVLVNQCAMGRIKSLLKNALVAQGFTPRRLRRFDFRRRFSYFDEEFILRRLLRALRGAPKTDFVVDIAASDGVTMSNTCALYRSGLPGLAVECDDERFRALSRHYRRLSRVQLRQSKVTPDNVCSLLAEARVPADFSVLSLDIDGYDYFVLAAILAHYRPAIICTEINESVPPPLKFAVHYHPDFVWATDHFFGQSLSKVCELAETCGYDLVQLDYNNAFLVRSDFNPLPVLAPREAYDQGYRLKPDRRENFPANTELDPVLDMAPPQALAFIEGAFRRHQGAFDLYL